jgi:hypothetical protein
MIPNTVPEICEMFDAQVMSDLAMYQFKEQLCYYIGAPDEPSAGLFAFSLTPNFFSMAALERYCKSKRGREEISRNAAEIFSEWDAEKQDWELPF